MADTNSPSARAPPLHSAITTPCRPPNADVRLLLPDYRRSSHQACRRPCCCLPSPISAISAGTPVSSTIILHRRRLPPLATTSRPETPPVVPPPAHLRSHDPSRRPLSTPLLRPKPLAASSEPPAQPLPCRHAHCLAVRGRPPSSSEQPRRFPSPVTKATAVAVVCHGRRLSSPLQPPWALPQAPSPPSSCAMPPPSIVLSSLPPPPSSCASTKCPLLVAALAAVNTSNIASPKPPALFPSLPPSSSQRRRHHECAGRLEILLADRPPWPPPQAPISARPRCRRCHYLRLHLSLQTPAAHGHLLHRRPSPHGLHHRLPLDLPPVEPPSPLPCCLPPSPPMATASSLLHPSPSPSPSQAPNRCHCPELLSPLPRFRHGRNGHLFSKPPPSSSMGAIPELPPSSSLSLLAVHRPKTHPARKSSLCGRRSFKEFEESKESGSLRVSVQSQRSMVLKILIVQSS